MPAQAGSIDERRRPYWQALSPSATVEVVTAANRQPAEKDKLAPIRSKYEAEQAVHCYSVFIAGGHL